MQRGAHRRPGALAHADGRHVGRFDQRDLQLRRDVSPPSSAANVAAVSQPAEPPPNTTIRRTAVVNSEVHAEESMGGAAVRSRHARPGANDRQRNLAEASACAPAPANVVTARRPPREDSHRAASAHRSEAIAGTDQVATTRLDGRHQHLVGAAMLADVSHRSGSADRAATSGSCRACSRWTHPPGHRARCRPGCCRCHRWWPPGTHHASCRRRGRTRRRSRRNPPGWPSR